MQALQPFRISNGFRCNTCMLVQQRLTDLLLSAVKERKDHYDLDIYIPGVKAEGYTVFISDHILKVALAANPRYADDGYLQVYLPSGINEDMVTARRTPNGIHVTLPKKSSIQTGRIIQVPLSQVSRGVRDM